MSGWEEKKKTAFIQSGKTDGLQWKMIITPKGDDRFEWHIRTGILFGNSWYGERETLEEAKRRAECVLEKVLEVHKVAEHGLRGEIKQHLNTAGGRREEPNGEPADNG